MREITKHFEEVLSGPLSELAARLEAAPVKGEIVIIVGPPAAPAPADAQSLEAAIRAADPARPVAQLATELAEALHLPRRQVYARLLELRGAR